MAEIIGLDMREVGLQFRRSREQQGLTQAWVADEVGIRHGTLSALECGRLPGLRLENFYALCRVLGLSADVVLGLP